ncbi:hypothetical protein [Nocardia jiangxiensis]|uniref:hypothetical protein n=1 Tax=Nocardia jiangxiensis TaxID=282685 RepID=UPI0002DFC8C9|nr:hypothetical protein [Nocardia jiangxiensis]
MLAGARARVAAEAARGPRLAMCAAARRDRFAVCAMDGTPVWLAAFHADLIVDSEAIAIELAGMHALWLAERVRERCTASAAMVRLVLTPRHPMTAVVLDTAAIATGLVLELVVDAPVNPAVELCATGALIDWRRADLGTLIDDPRNAS